MGKDYMTQLSKWARWMLPRQEAENVIADYHDIIGSPSRPKEELIQNLGKPWRVVKGAAQPKQYHIWLAVFSVLAVCVIFPIVMAYHEVYWDQMIMPVYMMFLFLGVGLSLWNFRQDRAQKGKLPRGIVLLLALLLIGMVGVWFLAGLVLTESWEMLNLLVPTPTAAQMLRLLLFLSILAMALITLCGLVKARLEDHRWRAVYILGLCGVLLGLSFSLLLRSLDLSAGPGWQTPILLKYAFITMLGLIGSGVALS